MQKVVGSSPIIRFTKAPQIAGFFFGPTTRGHVRPKTRRHQRDQPRQQRVESAVLDGIDPTQWETFTRRYEALEGHPWPDTRRF
jgi:hypothetical protein